MKRLYMFIIIPLFSGCYSAVNISTSEADASIMIDGKNMGIGPVKTKIMQDKCIKVVIEKTGFIKYDGQLCYNQFKPNTTTDKSIQLLRDEMFDASLKSDQANIDFAITINKKMTEADAWKVISQVVTNYFDLIEMSDKETGYMRTNWYFKSFEHSGCMRSRAIIKMSNSSPLTYKLKIVSEYSTDIKASVKDDDKFKESDRILKKYSDMISEFQTRLGSK